jgi:hypothetical protein
MSVHDRLWPALRLSMALMPGSRRRTDGSSAPLRWPGLRTGVIALMLSLTACHPELISHGSSAQLPQAGERLLVVGNQPGAVSTAITWLGRHQFTALEGRDTFMNRPDAAVLEQAKSVRAQVVVWIQQTGDLRAPMVAVRGIDADTHIVLWSGHARFDSYGARPVQDILARLTCSALAAVWNDAGDPLCP